MWTFFLCKDCNQKQLTLRKANTMSTAHVRSCADIRRILHKRFLVFRINQNLENTWKVLGLSFSKQRDTLLYVAG